MFTVHTGIEVLERTPGVLRALLGGLGEQWTTATEGPGTWSPHDVLGHLIHGERTDWMPRVRVILQPGGGAFDPFDMGGHVRESRGKSLAHLLDEFEAARRVSLAALRALSLTDADLVKTGIHPEFGRVTLRQHLSTWVAHDLDHLMQIARVMGKQLKTDVGPWSAYLRVVRD